MDVSHVCVCAEKAEHRVCKVGDSAFRHIDASCRGHSARSQSRDLERGSAVDKGLRQRRGQAPKVPRRIARHSFFSGAEEDVMRKESDRLVGWLVEFVPPESDRY